MTAVGLRLLFSDDEQTAGTRTSPPFMGIVSPHPRGHRPLRRGLLGPRVSRKAEPKLGLCIISRVGQEARGKEIGSNAEHPAWPLGKLPYKDQLSTSSGRRNLGFPLG